MKMQKKGVYLAIGFLLVGGIYLFLKNSESLNPNEFKFSEMVHHPKQQTNNLDQGDAKVDLLKLNSDIENPDLLKNLSNLEDFLEKNNVMEEIKDNNLDPKKRDEYFVAIKHRQEILIQLANSQIERTNKILNE